MVRRHCAFSRGHNFGKVTLSEVILGVGSHHNTGAFCCNDYGFQWSRLHTVTNGLLWLMAHLTLCSLLETCVIRYVVVTGVQFSPLVSKHHKCIVLCPPTATSEDEPPLVWSDTMGCDLGWVTVVTLLQMYRWPLSKSHSEFTSVMLQLEKHLPPKSSPHSSPHLLPPLFLLRQSPSLSTFALTQACAPLYSWRTEQDVPHSDATGTCYLSVHNFTKFVEYAPCRTGNCQLSMWESY